MPFFKAANRNHISYKSPWLSQAVKEFPGSGKSAGKPHSQCLKATLNQIRWQCHNEVLTTHFPCASGSGNLHPLHWWVTDYKKTTDFLKRRIYRGKDYRDILKKCDQSNYNYLKYLLHWDSYCIEDSLRNVMICRSL